MDPNNEGWNLFYDCINQVNNETLDSLSHDELLEYLYNLVDDSAEKFLNKKKCFSEAPGSKRKIPIKIRRLLRKKARLSKKYLESSS